MGLERVLVRAVERWSPSAGWGSGRRSPPSRCPGHRGRAASWSLSCKPPPPPETQPTRFIRTGEGSASGSRTASCHVTVTSNMEDELLRGGQTQLYSIMWQESFCIDLHCCHTGCKVKGRSVSNKASPKRTDVCFRSVVDNPAFQTRTPFFVKWSHNDKDKTLKI